MIITTYPQFRTSFNTFTGGIAKDGLPEWVKAKVREPGSGFGDTGSTIVGIPTPARNHYPLLVSCNSFIPDAVPFADEYRWFLSARTETSGSQPIVSSVSQPRFITAGGPEIYGSRDGGDVWSRDNLSYTFSALDVSRPSTTHAWACGTNGEIWASQDSGVTWSQQVSGTAENLLAIDFVNNATGWACGDAGTILSTIDGGATWVPQVSGVTGPLSGVSFFDATRGVVAGYDIPAPGSVATALRTSDGGATWLSVSLGVGNTVFDVEMATPAIGWICGTAPLFQKTIDGGASWSQVPGVAVEGLLGVSAISANDAWVVGQRGFVSRTINGTDWNNQASVPAFFLTGVKFVNALEGWASGSVGSIEVHSGAIFRTTDSGTTWVSQDLPSTTSAVAIDTPEISIGSMSFSGTAQVSISPTVAGATVVTPDEVVSIFKNTYLYVQRISDNAIQWVDLLGSMTANK